MKKNKLNIQSIQMKQENNNLKEALRELVNNHKIKDCTKPQNCICDRGERHGRSKN